jgi:hypothetical protein
MSIAQRRERLIAAAFYYYGLLDGGQTLDIAEFLPMIPVDLREELGQILPEVAGDYPPATYPTAEESSSLIETIRRLRHELRGA